MTEKEFILNIINRISLKVYEEGKYHIEFENGYGYESIIIDFDENGNITDIGC